jgi:lipid-A-disaccharide synthase
LNYYIIAGEKSGDLHGSNLIKSILQEDSQAKLRGIGGELMQKEGLQLFLHFHKVNFFGLFDVLSNFYSLYKIFKATENDILNFKPDVLILIDFAGFNLRMAKFAPKHGIKVYYYISPKIWAWNVGRAHKIKRLVDKMFVILPFEVPFYKQFDYEVEYVGNPIMDAIASFSPNHNFISDNQLNSSPIVALLPGSRPSEVNALLELMCALPKVFPSHQFVVAGVKSLPNSHYQKAIDSGIAVVYDQTYDLLTIAEAAVVASGTATLETGLFKVPQVVVYKVGKISYMIGKRLIKVRDIALVNLITDKIIVKTLLENDLNLPNLVSELKKVIKGGEARQEILSDYENLAETIGKPGASEKTGKLMVNYLKNNIFSR